MKKILLILSVIISCLCFSSCDTISTVEAYPNGYYYYNGPTIYYRPYPPPPPLYYRPNIKPTRPPQARPPQQKPLTNNGNHRVPNKGRK